MYLFISLLYLFLSAFSLHLMVLALSSYLLQMNTVLVACCNKLYSPTKLCGLQQQTCIILFWVTDPESVSRLRLSYGEAFPPGRWGRACARAFLAAGPAPCPPEPAAARPASVLSAASSPRRHCDGLGLAHTCRGNSPPQALRHTQPQVSLFHQLTLRSQVPR